MLIVLEVLYQGTRARSVIVPHCCACGLCWDHDLIQLEETNTSEPFSWNCFLLSHSPLHCILQLSSSWFLNIFLTEYPLRVPDNDPEKKLRILYFAALWVVHEEWKWLSRAAESLQLCIGSRRNGQDTKSRNVCLTYSVHPPCINRHNK